MTTTRPPRWQRTLDRRRSALRRMIAAGAVVGMLVGLVAQLLVMTGVESELRGLVRLALVLPAGIYVLWWLGSPGISLDRDEVEVDPALALDVDARIEKIESAFDESAMPRVGRHSVDPVDPARVDAFRRSIRRSDPTTPVDVAQFGIRHPEPSPPQAEQA